MQNNLLSLDEVKSYFEHWRTTRTKQRERIPNYLWDHVKTLIDRYSLMDITQALRINTGQIKDNIKTNPSIHFVEARINKSSSLTSKPIVSFSNSERTCSIELHRANGGILKIDAFPVTSLPAIINQFME